eukprot:10498753-Alexandrium_andersonii.AAC.1
MCIRDRGPGPGACKRTRELVPCRSHASPWQTRRTLAQARAAPSTAGSFPHPGGGSHVMAS